MPLPLAIYLMIGCCVGTLYASICLFGGESLQLEISGWTVFAVLAIAVTLIAAWPLWVGGVLICLLLQWLRVIG